MDNGESSSSSSGDKNKDEKEDDDKDNLSKEDRLIFDAKFKELQVYVPLIKKLLANYEQKKKAGSCSVQIEKQYQRFRSLHVLFTSKKRCKLDTLLKCEEFFKKRFKNKGNELSPEAGPSKTSEKTDRNEKCEKCLKHYFSPPHAEDCLCCLCNPSAAAGKANYVCSGPKPGPRNEEDLNKKPSNFGKPGSPEEDSKSSSSFGFGFADSGSFSSKFSPRCLPPKSGSSGEKSDVIVITDDEGKSPSKSKTEKIVTETKQTASSSKSSGGALKTSNSQNKLGNQTAGGKPSASESSASNATHEEVWSKARNKQSDQQNKLQFNKVNNIEAKNAAQNRKENKDLKVLNKPPLSRSAKEDQKKMRAEVTNQLDHLSVSSSKTTKLSHTDENKADRPVSFKPSHNLQDSSNPVTIPDLSQVDIPDHVYEIVKNLQLRMPPTFLNSKTPSQTEGSTSKPSSLDQKSENTSRSSVCPYQENFDIEPLLPSDRGLSSMPYTNNLPNLASSSHQPTYSSAHSSVVSSDLNFSSSHNVQIHSTSTNSLRHSMHADQSMNKIPSGTDVKPHSADPRRRPTSNIGGSSAQQSNIQRYLGKPLIADPRRRTSSDLQSSHLSINNQSHTQVTSLAGSWQHPTSRFNSTAISSHSSNAGPIRPYQHPAYTTPQVHPPSVSHHPPAFTSRSVTTSNCIPPSVFSQANRTSRFTPASSPQEFSSPAEDIIMNEDMQMSPDSPEETSTSTCPPKETSGTSRIRSKLAEGITTMQKLGKTPNTPRKDRMISNLKPGVVNDLAASRETKNSLFVDSLVNSQVPCNDKKDPKCTTPVKHSKVPEKNIDTINSLKTHSGGSSSRPPPIRPVGKALLPTPPLGRGNCDNTRFPTSNVPSSFNQKIPPRSTTNSSYNESIRTCFSANNESSSATDFNSTFRSSFHQPSAPNSAGDFNETFRSSFHQPVTPTYSDVLPRTGNPDQYKIAPSSSHRPVDSLLRSQSSPDPADLWSQTASRWNPDVRYNIDKRDRYDDYYSSHHHLDQRSNDRLTGDHRSSDDRFSDHRPSDLRFNDHRTFDRSDYRSRDPRSSDPRVSGSRTGDSRFSESIKSRPSSADPRARMGDAAMNMRKQNIRDEERPGNNRDPRRRSLETEGRPGRSRSRPPRGSKKSTVDDISRSRQKSKDRSCVKTIPEPDEREDFLSPLDNNARKPITSKTGRGYGIQNYKIPKKISQQAPRVDPRRDPDRDSAKKNSVGKESSDQHEISPVELDDSMDVDMDVDVGMNLGNDISVPDDSGNNVVAKSSTAKTKRNSPKKSLKSKKEEVAEKQPSKLLIPKEIINEEAKTQVNVVNGGDATDSEFQNEDTKKLTVDSCGSTKPLKSSKVTISGIPQTTSRVVISLDEESLARENESSRLLKEGKPGQTVPSDEDSENHPKKSDENAKNKSTPNRSVKTDPNKIVISDSSDDECTMRVRTNEPNEKLPRGKKLKTKKRKEKTKRKDSSAESDINFDESSEEEKSKASKTSIKKSDVSSDSDSDESHKGKKTKASKKSSSTNKSLVGSDSDSDETSGKKTSKLTNKSISTKKSLIQSDSESDGSSVGKTSKVSKMSSSTNKSDVKNKSAKKKALPGDTSDSDVPLKKSSSKKVKGIVKNVKVHDQTTDSSSSEGSDADSIKSKKKMRKKKQSGTKESQSSSSDSSSSASSIDSVNKQKKKKKSGSDKCSRACKQKDKSKMSESKITSSKKSGSKKNSKPTAEIIISSDSDSSDDEVLAVKVKKIKETCSSDGIRDKPSTDSKNTPSTKKQIIESDAKHQNNDVEDLIKPIENKKDQISCNKVDSTSDTNEPGAPKTQAATKDVLSLITDSLSSNTAFTPLLITMLLQEKLGPKFLENVELVAKLMEGDTLDKIKDLLTGKDKASSSSAEPIKREQDTPKAKSTETSEGTASEIVPDEHLSASSEYDGVIAKEDISKPANESVLKCKETDGHDENAGEITKTQVLPEVPQGDENGQLLSASEPEKSLSLNASLTEPEPEEGLSEPAAGCSAQDLATESSNASAVQNSNTGVTLNQGKYGLDVETVPDKSVLESQPVKVTNKVEHPRKRKRGKKALKKKAVTNSKQSSVHLLQNSADSLSIEERNQIYKEMCVGAVKNFETGPKQRKTKNELDKLHEDLRESFISQDVIKATGIRSCRVKAHEMDLMSPDDSLEKIPIARGRKKSSERLETNDKSTKNKAAKVKRKPSSQHINSSDSDEDSHKKPKRNSTDSPPPVLEAFTDLKENESLGVNELPSKSESPEKAPPQLYPSHEILPLIDPPSFFDLPEIYALDYFTPKFRRKRFNLAEFKSKYFVVKKQTSPSAGCSINAKHIIKFFGCGRRLDRKRKITSISEISTNSSGLSEPKKRNVVQNQVQPVPKARVSVKNIALSTSKMTSGRMTRMQVNKEDQKKAGSTEPIKIKTAEEVKSAIKMRKAAHMEEPDLDDFILILNKNSEKWSRVKNSLQAFNSITPKVTAEEAAIQYELKSEVDWTDPDYYFKFGASMDCKLCSYSGCHISDHYLLYHSEDQVLSSRLHHEEGESAIAESIFLDYSDVPDEFLIRFPASKECDGTVLNKESLNKLLLKKWLKDHSDNLTGVFQSLVNNCVLERDSNATLSINDEIKPKILTDLSDLLYRAYRAKMRSNLFLCRMCNNIYDNARKFFEHCSFHTGEYLYECTPCQLILPSIDDFVSHEESAPGNHFLSNRYLLPPESSILFGYICSSCNFVQLVYENLVRHLTYHKNDKFEPQIVRINMSKLSSDLFAESCEDAVAKKWHDYKKEDITSCSCPKFYLSFDDPKDVAKHFEKLSLKEICGSNPNDSTKCANPFARSFSSPKHKSNITFTDHKAPLPSSHSFGKIITVREIEHTNLEKIILRLSKAGKEPYLFSKSLRTNVIQLSKEHAAKPQDLIMDEEGRNTEHNYAFINSGPESFSIQLDKENSPQSRIKFLEDLHNRLKTKGGRNYLTELEKKLKLTEVEAMDLSEVLPLSLKKFAPNILKSKTSLESEAPTIHIPDSVECSLPKIMNVIDFNLHMTTESSESSVSILKPSNAFLNIGNLLTSSHSKESSTPKTCKPLPSLLSVKKPPQNQKYTMKDPAVRKLRVGPIGAVKEVNHVAFSCFAPLKSGKMCSHRTDTVEQLVTHFNSFHTDVKWTGLCEPCGQTIVARGLEKYPISIASNHLVSAHLSPVTIFELIKPTANPAITSVEGIPPESRPHTVIKNSPALPSCIITSPSKAVTTELPESSSSGVGNVVQVPPPLPQQPRLRVRPLEEMLDRKLLDQQMRDSSTAEKDAESGIQISSVMSLSSLGEDSPLKFVSETQVNSTESELPLSILLNTDKLLYLTPLGPKRLSSIMLRDPGSESGSIKSMYKFKLQSGIAMEELLKGQSTSFINAVKASPGYVLFMYCRVCSIYHHINIDLFKIECPRRPRRLILTSSELKFAITESSMVNHRMTHTAYPLLILQNIVKSPECYEAMLGPASLVKLYKCMGAVCSFSAVNGTSFIRHITNHETHVRAFIKRIGRNKAASMHLKTKEWNLCAYCGFDAEGPIDLKQHIEDEHGRSQFQCGHCFYRGFAKWHVAWHQVYAHEGLPPLIFACYAATTKALQPPNVDNLKPYKCAVGSCNFQTFARNSFQDHLSSQHINCNYLACHVCGVQYFTIDKLIMHYKLHNYYQYQCLYCNDGSESQDDMKLHLLNNHFSRASYIINRILPNESQRQLQSKITWAKTNALDDKITFVLLKETQDEVKAISCNMPVMDDCEDVAIEEEVYLQMIAHVMDLRAQKSRATVENSEQEEVEFEAVIRNSNEEGAFADSRQNFTPQFSNAQSSGLETNLLPFIRITTPDQRRKIEEKKQLHQSTLENRLKTLEGVYNPESRLLLLQTPTDNLKNLKDILSASTSSPSLTKYLQNPSDLKKDTGTFELTQDCIDSLSLDFNNSVDLNTLYDMVDSPAVITETSQANCNQPSNDAVNGISSIYLNQTSDNAEDTGLSGLELYRCGNEGCTFAAESSNDLKDHVLMCDLSRSSSSLTCVHCKKLCKAATNLVEHLRTHGTQRFFCSLCTMRAPVPYRISTHLKSAHRINSARLHPVNPLQTDIDNSVFILVPKDKQLIGVNKVNAKTGCKISFSPSEISDIPHQKIYAEPMWCAVCPYKSMIRINLLNHLRNHAIGNEPLIKDYFNPLSTSESIEPEPLTNHALSARMAEEKAMKEAGAPVLTEHIMEDLHSNFLTEFVPPNGRYKCHVPDCSYITVDASTLCNHLKSLHSDVKTYLCPHCPPNLAQAVKLDKIRSHLKFHDDTLLKCSYCDFYHHKKHTVDRHVVLKHPSFAQKTELIRGSESSKVDSPDISQASSDSQRGTLKPWHCGLCRVRSFVQAEIAEHCFSVHGVYNQYKCVLCTYSNNSLYDFNAHYLEKHHGVSKQILCVYEEVTSFNDNDPVNNVLDSRDICHYIPEKFRLKNGLAEERVSLSTEDYIKLKGRNRMLAALGIDDKNGLHGPVGEPDSKGNFVCPRCKEYRTSNVDDMKCHMYRELNYKLFKCGHCNLASSQFHDLFIHSEEHVRLGDEACVQQLEPNPDYDAWIDRMIAVQKSMMKSKKEGQSKEDPPAVENKFWRFGVCSRECMPSYQHYCPNIPVSRPVEEDTPTQDTNKYRQPPVSDDSDVDNYIDMIVSDDEGPYKLAQESIPAPTESISASLTLPGSKIEKYRKSKLLPKIDLKPPQYSVLDESELQLLESSSEDEIIVDSDDGEVESGSGLKPDLNDSPGAFTHKCVDCGKGYSTTWSLKLHIRRVHLVTSEYVCRLCKESFQHHQTMKSHLTKMHGDSTDKNYTVLTIADKASAITPEFWAKRYNIQEEPAKKVPKKLSTTLQDELRYSCCHCPYKSTDLAAMYVHWRQKHKDPQLLTNGKIRPSTNLPFGYRNISKKVDSAEDKALYECIHCGFRSSMQKIIPHHLTLHSAEEFLIKCLGQVKYKCAVCHMDFLSIDNLKRHFSQAHPGKEVQCHCFSRSDLPSFSRLDDGKKSVNFLAHCNKPGKLIFFGCPVCRFFSDDPKKMLFHLRKHIDVYFCKGCKKSFPDVHEANYHCHYQCTKSLRVKSVKKSRLSRRQWEELKGSVKCYERSITAYHLSKKYLPVEMPQKKKKHRSKGIPQKSDVKRMKLSHCAKKSTASIGMPAASTNTSGVRVSQTARKSTGPRTTYDNSMVPFSFYGRKPDLVDFNQVNISFQFGGSQMLRPVSVLCDLLKINLNPIVRVLDYRKIRLKRKKNPELVEIND